jgi:pimeloyl-ACP methyl ester carboxylesterase
MEVVSRGHRIHFEAEGAGPALVLIPGILQSAQRWIDVGYLDVFTDSHRVIVVDPLGHGRSDKPHDADAYAESLHAADVCAVLDAESVTSAHLWGYSGGALHAIGVCLVAPHRVRSLTLGGIPPAIPLEYRPAVFQPWVEALRVGDWEQFWRHFLPVDATTQALLQETNDPLAVAAALAGMLPWEPELGAVTAPTLVYMGTKEIFFDHARQTADEIGAAFHPVADRGHAGAFQDLAAIESVVRRHIAEAERCAPTATMT